MFLLVLSARRFQAKTGMPFEQSQEKFVAMTSVLSIYFSFYVIQNRIAPADDTMLLQEKEVISYCSIKILTLMRYLCEAKEDSSHAFRVVSQRMLIGYKSVSRERACCLGTSDI